MTIELSGYALGAAVYEGAETSVHRGQRLEDGKPVAIKLTREEHPPSPRELGRLQREYDILTRIASVPGVGKALAFVSRGTGAALILEDLGETSLHQALSAGRLDVATALDIGASLASTLADVHHQGVIHKDIKPRNVMVGPGPSAPRIIDFGISARLSQEISAPVSIAAMEGTVAYMSPEQTGHMNRPLDRRSDLYSLGVTLYEMLTGTVPFAGTDAADVLYDHLSTTPIPPHERVPSVPRGLSDLVMKLLAKAPEDRYQTARGVNRDLETCITSWAESAQIEPFPLGRFDISDELIIPQKLYGREADVKTLVSAFERVVRGGTELVLVSGFSGVGKSALVNELRKPIAIRGGSFASGKFDQVDRSVPLAAIAHALRELVRQILSEPDTSIVLFRVKVLEALGQNGRLLVDLVPELAQIIGPQPDVPALPSTEAKNRFGLLMQRFVRTFASPSRPLVLFLDDLQWADPASLDMLSVLLTDPESKFLLVVGAYRDSEVDAAHPLTSTLESIKKNAPVSLLEVGPLDETATAALVADTVRGGTGDVAALAAVVFEKTRGNPFFVNQFLRLLHEQGLLSFDKQRGAFAWDVASIRQADITNDVLALMLGKLARMSGPTASILELASCIGHTFDLGTLAIMAEMTPHGAAEALWEALREGLVIPLDGDYRFLDAGEGFAKTEEGQRVSYRFLHDRVREAAYARIPEEKRQALHLAMGRHLLDRCGKNPKDDELFEIVRHLNLSRAAITDPQERAEIAALDLRAGKRAKASTAYVAASDYLDAGADLLGEEGFLSSYDLCFALHAEAAECAYLGGQTEPADARFDALLPRAKTDLERARILNLRVQLYATRGKFSDAVKAGLAGLALLGITFPETPEEQAAAFGAGMMKVGASLAGRNVDDLVNLPTMTDPSHRLALEMLKDLTVPIYFVNTALYAPIVFEMVDLSLKHGNSDVSGFAYMAYSFLNCVFLGQVDLGYAFGRLAVAVNDKQKGLAYACKIYVLFSAIVVLREPARALLEYAKKVRQTGLESGDFVSVSSLSYTTPVGKLLLGIELAEIREDVDKAVALTRRTHDKVAIGCLTAVRRAIANLRGQTSAPSSFAGEKFDEQAFCDALDPKDESNTVLYFHFLRMVARYLRGDYAGAVADAEAAEPFLMVAVGSFNATQFSAYACLALLALPKETDPEKAEKRAAAIAGHKAKIAGLAATCPLNFEQWKLVLEAEEARHEGKYEEGIALCDRAIELTEKSEVYPTAWIANELAAKLYLALGKPKLARPYMTDAYMGYLRWGATAKADEIAAEHEALLPRGTDSRRRSSTGKPVGATTAGTTLFGSSIGSIREAALVVRAAQAIASELALEKVIERLLKLVLDNAGAQRGLLLLVRGEKLSIEARFSAHPEQMQVGLNLPLPETPDFAKAVVNYVVRTRDAINIDDAYDDQRFAEDPWLAAHKARAVLCLPLMHQGRLIGMLYLEHAEAKAAFSVARVELLELFASQAAIAIENARLLSDVQEANAEVRRVNDRLESEVAARTEEIAAKAQELEEANERLSLELFEREQTEIERERLQQQMLDAQAARLQEMSTPLIPITDRIVVLPLIGTVDNERAAQVLEVALEGAVRHQATVVILDITGMKHVDAAVVSSLMATASALRLLGAQAVLTGIRPEVAQAMIGLGVDMAGIVTKSTLKSGIAHALQRSGETSLLTRTAKAKR